MFVPAASPSMNNSGANPWSGFELIRYNAVRERGLVFHFRVFGRRIVFVFRLNEIASDIFVVLGR